MKLHKFVIGIYKRSTGEHVLESYHAENAAIAAYLIAANCFGIEFSDNEDRSEFHWDEVEQEFLDYGYSVRCISA